MREWIGKIPDPIKIIAGCSPEHNDFVGDGHLRRPAVGGCRTQTSDGPPWEKSAIWGPPLQRTVEEIRRVSPPAPASRQGVAPAVGMGGTPPGTVDAAVFPDDPSTRTGATGPQALGGPGIAGGCCSIAAGAAIGGGAGGSAAAGIIAGAAGTAGGRGWDGTHGLAAGADLAGSGSLGGTMAVPDIARESAGNWYGCGA